MNPRKSIWSSLPVSARRTLQSAWRCGVPPTSTALFARWWQLETWLRSLVHVELRADAGPAWLERLPARAERYERNDQGHEYMASPDAQARLAYLDVGDLLKVVDDNWNLFEPALLDRGVWPGRVEELRKIRNRIGHCRRPHPDDLGRLEQTLRDLEPGAFRAAAAFNRQSRPEQSLADPVVEAWVRGRHEVAARLIGHAEQQYDTRFMLRYSRRLWADNRDTDDPITGRPGYIWHACWVIGSSFVDLDSFWNDYLDDSQDLILLVCAPSPGAVEISFPAALEGNQVADAIGRCFDALLLSKGYGAIPGDIITSWQQRNESLDPRIDVGSPWSVIDDTTTPVTIFGA